MHGGLAATLNLAEMKHIMSALRNDAIRRSVYPSIVGGKAPARVGAAPERDCGWMDLRWTKRDKADFRSFGLSQRLA